MSETEVKELQTEVKELSKIVTELSTDLKWIKHFFWVVTTAIITNSIGLIFLILKMVLIK